MLTTLSTKRIAKGFAVAAVLLTGTTAHAQQKSWDDVVKAAKQEGNVVLYSSLVPAALERLIDSFQKKYPEIKVQNVRTNDAVLVARVQQEQSTKAAGGDVASSNGYDFYEDQIKVNNLVKPIGPSIEKYKGDGMPWGLAPVITAYPMGFGYNTDLVKDAPTKFEDFLKPEYKNAVGIIDVTAASSVAFYYDSLRKQIPGWLEKFATQNPILHASSIPTTQAIASGEIKGSPFVPPGVVKALQDQGAKLKFVIPDMPEVYGVRYPMAILANAKNPNAAQVFVDFVASPDGQYAMNGDGMGMSELDGIKGALAKTKIFIYNNKEFSPEQIKATVTYWNGIFKK